MMLARVLRAAGVEPAQDLLALGGAKLQRPRVLDHLVVLLGDQVPVDRPGQHRLQPGRVRAVRRPVQPGGADVLQPGQQPVAEQVGEREPDHAGAVGVGVVRGDLRVGVGGVPDQALHHRRHLTGGIRLELRVHAPALAFDVPSRSARRGRHSGRATPSSISSSKSTDISRVRASRCCPSSACVCRCQARNLCSARISRRCCATIGSLGAFGRRRP